MHNPQKNCNYDTTREHPDWKDSWVEGTVISTLMKEKDEAILLKKNYAFETNFSSDLPVNLIKDFKNANYKICLIYFGLSHIIDSSTRVDQHHILGGHNVNQKRTVSPFLILF